MAHARAFVLFLALGVTGLVACTAAATPDPAATAFALTQTAYVAALRTAATATAQARPTPTPWPSTPTPTPSPTPTSLPTPTPLPVFPARATGYLHCRQGPAAYYPEVALLEPGQDVQVVGRNPVYYSHLLVQLPGGATCWAWTRWLDVQADEAALARLPVATPPPPPAAAFVYPKQNPLMLGFCPTLLSPALQVYITNRGWKPLRSLEAEILVLETGARYKTSFPNGIPMCTRVLDGLRPGGTAAVALRTRENLLEKRIRLTVKMCTETGFRGDCVSYAVIWTLPKPVPVFPFPFPRP